MRLADLVTPQDLKDINLILLREGAWEIGGAVRLLRRVRGRARMVRDSVLGTLLAEIPGVTSQAARGAWSHWMALVTTRQPFFDANHRTAFIGFNRATSRAWGFEYTLSLAQMEAMMEGSRALVQKAHRPAAGARVQGSVEALRDREHPVRTFYAGFEGRLRQEPQ